MKNVIVYGHPWEKSFNHATLEAVIRGLESENQDYTLIDLYGDDFDPRYSAEELALFSKGEALDPLVQKYQEIMIGAEKLIFIFPVWWNDVPSIIKGFLDKVMLREFSYVDTPRGIKGKMTHIEEALVVTTSTSPKWYLKYFSGNAVAGVFMNTTLKSLGIKKRNWLHLGQINTVSSEKRQEFLKSVCEYVQ
ncbi:NAD(P)H-dependent oxidoreductase [Listeria aquatica]|uniref:NAD(P)H-dependent oxidoreductase n=1 Tax=Listeria aquatica TaxID=1494960 RepID=UPI003F6FBA42